MKKFKIIVSSILMCIILFVVFAFSDDKELQKDVVEKMTDTIVDIATNESTTEILSLTADDMPQNTHRVRLRRSHCKAP